MAGDHHWRQLHSFTGTPSSGELVDGSSLAFGSDCGMSAVSAGCGTVAPSVMFDEDDVERCGPLASSRLI